MSMSGGVDGADVVASTIDPTTLYVTPEALAKQMAYRMTGDPRLELACDAASRAIDDWCGRTEPFPAPQPSMVCVVALSLAVDLWKQADATFGIMGMAETGPVRVARDLVQRYDASLIPFYDTANGWGVA